ncbi:MAG TPA: amidohydrolase family protein [Longimicrobiaceae bacterium]|nr:amidohydrolase family protein [Longimicrobiaceae bacterium]
MDCHTHLNRYTPDEPPSLAGRYARLRAEMEAHGVGYALVISSYRVDPDRPGTGEILEMVEGDPRLGVVAGIGWPRLEAGDLGEVREWLEAGRLRGLKLYPGYDPFPLHDRRVHPVYELAAEFRVPVMIHTGDTYARRAKVRYAHPLEADEVAVDFRDTVFVLCHLGNPWFLDAAEVVYKNENVFADISGLTLGAFEPRFECLARSKLNEAIAYLNDPTKLLYGSDWPISEMGSYLRFVGGLETTPEEREGMLWRNAARVFGVEPGAGGAEDPDGVRRGV